MSLAAWWLDTVREFGRQLGIEELTPGGHGLVQLVFADGGLLAVEPVEREQQDEVMVYLARPAGYDAAMLWRRALARAHHSQGLPRPLQVAVRGDGPQALIVALVRLQRSEFTLQALAHAFDFLDGWHQELRRG